MFFQIFISISIIISSFLIVETRAVINSREFKRREAIHGYEAPPLPIPVYGVPGLSIKYPSPPPDIPPLPSSNSISHTKYGIPQPLPPSREHGIPYFQYGPPKINTEYATPFFKNNLNNIHSFQYPKSSSSFHNQIKSHFGIPKPVYGPPHQKSISVHKYGPPPQFTSKPVQAQNINGNLSLKLAAIYSAANIGGHGSSTFSAIKSGPIQAPIYTGPSQPALVYGAPNPLPPHLPSHIPTQPPATSYGVPDRKESHISSNLHNNIALHSIQNNNVLENNNHGGPITSCDGWKPIPGPVGSNLNIPVSDIHQGQSNSNEIDEYHHSSSSTTSGLTDDQIIAIALGGGGGSSNGGVSSSDHGNYQRTIVSNSDDYHLAHNTNSVQSHSSEQTSSGISDTYSAPPPDSYAPNSIHSAKYSTINTLSNDPLGLVPPSGFYETPIKQIYHSNEVHNAGLGISHGTQSGNLKPGTSHRSAPKRPVFYRPPVPQGLLESIGASVKHMDQYGVPPPNQPSTYIPPPPAEIPQSSVEEHQITSHSEHIPQSLPSLQEPRFNQAQDCGHGPVLNNEYNTYDLRYNQGPVYNHLDSQSKHSSKEELSDSYGPPPSGNAVDALTYESKQNVVQVSSQQPTYSQSQFVELNSKNYDESIINQQYSKSNIVTIPVQGQLGAYHLQFQSADPLGSSQDTSQKTNHEQILTEGLLQQILSAIEQQGTSNTAPSIQNEELQQQVERHSDQIENDGQLHQYQTEDNISKQSTPNKEDTLNK